MASVPRTASLVLTSTAAPSASRHKMQVRRGRPRLLATLAAASAHSLLPLTRHTHTHTHHTHTTRTPHAEKRMSIAKLPDVLSLHLKRFRHDGYWSSKVSTAVAFPLEVG